jgi:hypothetical protein
VSAIICDRSEKYVITQLFTFGYGHVCPVTGRALDDHYATIVAADRNQARAVMWAMFGRNWAFQYDADSLDGYLHLTEHVRIDLTPGASARLAACEVLARKWTTVTVVGPTTDIVRACGENLSAALAPPSESLS